MNDAKVIIRRGEAVDEYPLPLPMLPTYRELNLIRKVTGQTIGEILSGAGDDPDADFAVAIYALMREKGPQFTVEDAERLFNLPFGAIEIHFGTFGGDGDADPKASPDGSQQPRSDSVDESANSNGSTTETPEEPGTQP